ncbi:MAG: dephospho-CoA kinase [Ruminococcaceae bacterium]|nr:dephospho-CoA kinase [Oscillospiraceae bacterium]
MKILGVTGGSGTGKSSVCTILKEEGGKIIDADKITRKLQQKGGAAYEEIVAVFTEAVLLPDGELDRKKLGDIVFADPVALRTLNSIVHKHVTKEIKRRVAKYSADDTGKYRFLVLDVPIPIEEGFFDTVDYVWAVVANNDLRVARLMQRMGITEEEAEKRISAQMSNREYEELADCTIENEEDIFRLRSLVAYELKRFLAQ